MDASKKYIDMCRGAEEIQLQRASHYEEGDFHTLRDSYLYTISSFSTYGTKETVSQDEVWLPRLDQLYEIWNTRQDTQEASVNSHPIIFVNNLKDFIQRFIGVVTTLESKSDYLFPMKERMSIEQWTLLLVMKTLYDKRYVIDTKQWIKIEDNEKDY